jgi:hypothetical protein
MALTKLPAVITAATELCESVIHAPLLFTSLSHLLLKSQESLFLTLAALFPLMHVLMQQIIIQKQCNYLKWMRSMSFLFQVEEIWDQKMFKIK